MPVLAVPGATVPASSAALSAPAFAAPDASNPAAATRRTSDPVDVVTLSPAALMQQVLDAPVLAMRRLGGLLQEFEQIDALTRPAAPRMLGALAVDIGTAARDLGGGAQTLLRTTDTPAPLEPEAAATLRVLATLAPAVATPRDMHAASDPRTPDPHATDDPADERLAGTLPPAGRPTQGAPGTPPAASLPASRTAPSAAAPVAPISPGSAPPGSAPPGSASPGSASPGSARPGPARPGSARPGSARPDPAPPEPPSPGRTRPAAAPPSPAAPRAPARPGPEFSGRDPSSRDIPRPDLSRPDPVRQAREAVLALLGEAAATLGRMRLRAAPAPPLAEAARDEAWCESQIAAALGSVAHAARTVEGPRPAGTAGIDALLAALAATPQGTGQAVRLGSVAALLCCLAVALWATLTLDLGVARTLTAAALGVAALAWGWRRAAGGQVRVEVRRQAGK